MTPSDLDAIERAAHLGAAVVDGDGRHVAVGPAYCRLLGTAAADLVGAPVEEDSAMLRFTSATLPDGGRLVLCREAADDGLEGLLDAVREADRRKDEFLALLGHELRNPLAP